MSRITNKYFWYQKQCFEQNFFETGKGVSEQNTFGIRKGVSEQNRVLLGLEKVFLSRTEHFWD